MEVGDNTEFRNRLVALAEVFDVKLSPQRQALYFEALRDVPFPRVAAALNAAVKGCRFFPKPAELRTLALGDDEDRAESAWQAFRGAMLRVGSYRSLATTDPALGEAIRALFGGWPEACAVELSPEMWASKRKEFGRVYRVLCQRQLTGTRYLPGLVEQQNAGRREWFRYVDVGVLGTGGTVQMLRGEQADAYRAQIAGEAHGLQRVGELELPVPQSLSDAG